MYANSVSDVVAAGDGTVACARRAARYVMSTQDKLIGGLAKWPLYRSGRYRHCVMHPAVQMGLCCACSPHVQLHLTAGPPTTFLLRDPHTRSYACRPPTLVPWYCRSQLGWGGWHRAARSWSVCAWDTYLLQLNGPGGYRSSEAVLLRSLLITLVLRPVIFIVAAAAAAASMVALLVEVMLGDGTVDPPIFHFLFAAARSVEFVSAVFCEAEGAITRSEASCGAVSVRAARTAPEALEGIQQPH